MPDTYDPFDWGATATSLGLAHAPSRPNDADIGDGYQSEEPIPAEEFNWLAAFVGRLSVTAHVYPDPPTAMATMEEGDLSFIDEYDGDHVPGGYISAALTTATQTGNDVVSVDTDGAITVFLSSDGTAKAVKSRWTLANFATTDAICTYTLTNSGTERVIRTNGEYTCIAYGQYVEIFDALTGSSVAVIDHGAAVYDICMDGTQVYLVGASGTGSKEVRSNYLLDGSAKWAYAHAATVYACCTDGRKLYIAGAQSGSGSGATLRGIEAQTGWDVAGEGGISTSGWADVFDVDTSAVGVVSRGQVMVTDGRGLWIGYDTTQAHQIEQRGTKGGTLLVAWDDTSHHVQALAIDQSMVLAAVFTATNGHLHGFDKAMFPSMRWSFQGNAAAVQEPLAVCSDGFEVTIGGSDTAGTKTLGRHYRRTRPTQIRKVDPSDIYNPYRLAFIPAGE